MTAKDRQCCIRPTMSKWPGKNSRDERQSGKDSFPSTGNYQSLQCAVDPAKSFPTRWFRMNIASACSAKRRHRHRIFSAHLQKTAEEYARRALTELNYVGVLAIELFECKGHLLVNEMAPRVHNSGHWTIEGAETSQFRESPAHCSGTAARIDPSRGLLGDAQCDRRIAAYDRLARHSRNALARLR